MFFGVSVPSDVDEETKALGIPRVHMTGGISDYFIDKDGNKLTSKFISGPFYDIPAAKENPGLVYRLTDAGLRGSHLYSDGARYRAFGGRITIGVQYDSTPSRSATVISTAKFKIPYSPIEGSLLGMGDRINIRESHERTSTDAGDTSRILHRSFYLGKDNSILNNLLLHKTNTSASNRSVGEDSFEFSRVDSTTLRILGVNNGFDNWNGPSPSPIYSRFGITGFDNLDLNDIYLDLGFNFAAASPTVDAFLLHYMTAEIITCGPGA